MPAKLDQTLVAKSLADATVFGPAVAARANGVSLATIARYQKSLQPDTPLAAEVQAYLNSHDESWAESIRRALKAGIIFLLRASHDCDPSDPSAVEAITKAVVALSDVDMTIQVLQQKLESKRP